MFRGLLTAACILVGASAGIAAPVFKDPAKGMPHLVFQFKAVDEWFADYDNILDHLKDLPEQEKTPNSAEVRKILSGLFAGWSEAIDTSRPIGVYVTFSSEIEKTRPVVMLPTKSEKAFREMVGKFYQGGMEDKDDAGLFTFQFVFLWGSGTPAFFRVKDGYIYLTLENRAAIQDPKKLPAVGDILLKDETSLVAMRWYAEGMPAEIKKLVHGILAETEKKGRVGLSELFLMGFLGTKDLKEFFARLNQLVDESKWFSVRLDFDRKSGGVIFEFNLIPQQGTALAKEISAFKPRKSRFGELIDKNTAIGGIYALGSFGGIKGEFPEAIAHVKDILTEVDLDGPDDQKVAELAKALQNALQMEGVDLGVAMKRADADKEFFVVGGAHLKKSPELILATLKYMAALPAEKRKRFQPNAVKLTDKLTAHKLTLDLPVEYKKTFGETDLYFVSRDDVVFFAFGKNAVDRLKETLDMQPKEGGSLQIELVPEKFSTLLELPNDKKPAELWNKLFAKTKKIKLLSLYLEGGPALKVRYSADATDIIKIVSYVRRFESGAVFDLKNE